MKDYRNVGESAGEAVSASVEIFTKPWWKSKTLIGAVVLIAAFAVESWAPGVAEQSEIAGLIEGAAQLFGIAMVIWGRITAESKVKL